MTLKGLIRDNQRGGRHPRNITIQRGLCLIKTLRIRRMNNLECRAWCFDKMSAMTSSLRHLIIGWILNLFRSRQDLILENLALRQQLLALHTKRPRRPTGDRAQAVLDCAAKSLVRMEAAAHSGHPENGCGSGIGRLPAVLEMALTRQTNRRPKAGERRNSGPHLPHGGRESNLGSAAYSRRIAQARLRLSEPTVSRWLRRHARELQIPPKRWLTFLRNHREAIAAMDFFTVPTLTFGVLYCFFVIGHDRRKILRFNVTRNPEALWIVQQMREAWPYTAGPPIPALRPRLQVWPRRGIVREGHRNPANAHRLSQSVAERGR